MALAEADVVHSIEYQSGVYNGMCMHACMQVLNMPTHFHYNYHPNYSASRFLSGDIDGTVSLLLHLCTVYVASRIMIIHLCHACYQGHNYTPLVLAIQYMYSAYATPYYF